MSGTIPAAEVPLSGHRLAATYLLSGDEQIAHEKAQDICLEQTVELPADLLPAGDIRERIVGRIESIEPVAKERFRARISFAIETTGLELTQLLNVLFGNISLKPGIRLEQLDLPQVMLAAFRGPRFGSAGWRDLLAVPARPLLCTAVKPMGLPPNALADLVYRFALGGIDIIKDDHGIADQPFAPYRDRVARCAEALHRANRETGHSCIYMPNVSGPLDRLLERARAAKAAGAGALLVAPGLIGIDAVRLLAETDEISLPLMSHPALQGSFVTSATDGVTHGILFAQLTRLMGADATIFPSWGGRFAFTRTDCAEITMACARPMGTIKPILPTPAGGMTLDRLPEMLELYGRDVIFLIGGGLHRHGLDLMENCRYFRRIAEGM